MRSVLGCLAVIAAADYVITRRDLPWHAVALADHPAHLGTAALFGGTDPRYLAGSLLPDLDHVPLALRSPRRGDPRPRTHSLAVLVPIAAVSPKLAAGAATHLVRDLALDPGVPLLWPLTRRSFRVPYAVYAAALIATALWRSRPGSATPRDGTSAPATGSA